MKLPSEFCREQLKKMALFLYTEKEVKQVELWTNEECIQKFTSLVEFVAFTVSNE